MTRHERVYNAIKALFDASHNELLTIRNIRHRIKEYNEEELYHALKKLLDAGYINKRCITHKRYYWISRYK